jgi:hypothetical protein
MISDISLGITITTILALLGGLSVTVNGINIIRGWFRPVEDVRKILSKHEAIMEEERKKLELLREEIKMTLKCLAALLESEFDPAAGEEIKREARDALNRFLINR